MPERGTNQLVMPIATGSRFFCRIACAVTVTVALALSPGRAIGQDACHLCKGPWHNVVIVGGGLAVTVAAGTVYGRTIGGYQAFEWNLRTWGPGLVILGTGVGTVIAGYRVQDTDVELFETMLTGAILGGLAGKVAGWFFGPADARLAGPFIGLGAGIVVGSALGWLLHSDSNVGQSATMRRSIPVGVSFVF